MQKYTFYGVVNPERARVNIEPIDLEINPLDSKIKMDVFLHIINNQILLTIRTPEEDNIRTLRNIAKYIVRSEVALYGFVRGYAFDIDIRRVTNEKLKIDYVYGVEIPCLKKRNEKVDKKTVSKKLKPLMEGELGVYIYLCFDDLSSAMRNSDRTAFYCYRAIESLKKHCSNKYNILDQNDSAQWKKFREVSNCCRSHIDYIKDKADPLRHGDPVKMSDEESAKIFTKTWDIVDGYLEHLQDGT